MTRAEFSAVVNQDGYMLHFHGKPIGGAGVRLPREKPLHWRHRAANLKDNRASAEYDIDEILEGRPAIRYAMAIAAIVQEEGGER